jgi:hypothetical protein
VNRFDMAADPERFPDRGDRRIRRWLDAGLTPDEVLDEVVAQYRPTSHPMTAADRRWASIRIAALAATMKRPPATWRNVEDWTEQDFRDRVATVQADGGKGGYRTVAARCIGWSPTQLLRRWQRVSGGKPWPSGQDAPLHRE